MIPELGRSPGVGVPGGIVIRNLPAKQETQESWVQSLGQEDPLEKKMETQDFYVTVSRQNFFSGESLFLLVRPSTD